MKACPCHRRGSSRFFARNTSHSSRGGASIHGSRTFLVVRSGPSGRIAAEKPGDGLDSAFLHDYNEHTACIRWQACWNCSRPALKLSHAAANHVSKMRVSFPSGREVWGARVSLSERRLHGQYCNSQRRKNGRHETSGRWQHTVRIGDPAE